MRTTDRAVELGKACNQLDSSATEASRSNDDLKVHLSAVFFALLHDTMSLTVNAFDPLNL